MGDYRTWGQKKNPSLGSGIRSLEYVVSKIRAWLPVEENQPVFDGHTHQPGQVANIQLGHQIGAVLFDGSRFSSQQTKWTFALVVLLVYDDHKAGATWSHAPLLAPRQRPSVNLNV